MLNFIAVGGLVAGLLVPRFIDDPTATNSGNAAKIAESGRLPDLNSWLEIFTREITQGPHG